MLSQDVRPSVRPSDRHTPAFYQNRQTLNFSLSGSHIILVFQHQMVWQYAPTPTETYVTGASNAGGMKKWRFSANISLYLDNYTR